MIQARLLGRSAIGIDVDPIAHLIASVIARQYRDKELRSTSNEVVAHLRSIRAALANTTFDEHSWHPGIRFSINGLTGCIPKIDKLSYWFAPVQRVILGAIVGMSCQRFHKLDDRVVKLAVSSSIIHKWPHTLSRAMDIDHSRPHRIEPSDLSVDFQVGIFERSFRTVVRFLGRLNALAVSNELRYEAHGGDSAETLRCIEADSVDYVLTSPPYFNAIDYPRGHKFAAWWLWPEGSGLSRASYIGLKPGGPSAEHVEMAAKLLGSSQGLLNGLPVIGSPIRRSVARYVVDMNHVIVAIRRVLKPNAPLTFLIADNSIKGAKVPSTEITAALLRRNDFHSVSATRRAIERTRRRYPFEGFKGLMTTESVVSAVKP